MSLAPSWAPFRRWWEREAAGSGSLVVVKEFRDSAARRSGLFTTRGVRARPVRALCRVAKVPGIDVGFLSRNTTSAVELTLI